MSGEYTTEPNHYGFEGRTHSNEKNEMEYEDKSQGERDMEHMDTIIVIKDKECLHKQRTSMSGEHTTEPNHFGFAGGTHSNKNNQMEYEDNFQGKRDMEHMDTIIVIKDKECLHKQSQEEEENNVASSTSSPYGDWAEKRRQACEYKRLQKMERELRMQVGIKKHRDRVKQEAKKQMKHPKTILVTKEKEVLKEAKSLSSSASSPYGNWAEKRRQACEYKRLQKMERELRMQVGIKKHRDRVKQEVKKDMKHKRPLR
jgi:hypothetical protein